MLFECPVTLQFELVCLVSRIRDSECDGIAEFGVDRCLHAGSSGSYYSEHSSVLTDYSSDSMGSWWLNNKSVGTIVNTKQPIGTVAFANALRVSNPITVDCYLPSELSCEDL